MQQQEQRCDQEGGHNGCDHGCEDAGGEDRGGAGGTHLGLNGGVCSTLLHTGRGSGSGEAEFYLSRTSVCLQYGSCVAHILPAGAVSEGLLPSKRTLEAGSLQVTGNPEDTSEQRPFVSEPLIKKGVEEVMM